MRIGITFDYKAAGIKAAQNGLKALAKTALGTSLSVAGAATAINRMVRSAAEQQRAFANLGQTMRNVGFVGAEHQAKALFNQLELQYGVVTDDLLPAYRTLFNTIGGLTLSQEALNTAIVTSIGSGKDLNTVTSALTKAYRGETTALAKLNIGLTKAELSSMSFDEVMARLNQKFSGAAATNAEQFATKMDRIKLAVNQATDAIGEGFIFAIEESGRRSGTTIDDITSKIVQLGTRTSQYIRLISLRWGETSKSVENSWLGELLDNARYNNPTFLGKVFELAALGLRAFNDEASKLQDPFAIYNPSTRADRMTASDLAEALAKQEQRRLYLAEQARRRTAAAEAARKRKEEAQRKKQMQLDQAANELQKQFDLDRISIAAALAREQDQGTQDRLNALMTLNDLQYMQNASLTEMDALLAKINEHMKKLAENGLLSADALKRIAEAAALQNAIDQAKSLADALDQIRQRAEAASAAAAAMMTALYNQGQGKDPFYSTPGPTEFGALSNADAAAALTNMFPEIDRGAEAPGSFGQMPGTITININALSTMDIEEAIAAAVNSGGRSGLSYTQLFSRL